MKNLILHTERGKFIMKKFEFKKFAVMLSIFMVLFLVSTAFASNQAAFDEFKNLIQTQYIFRDFKGVNWPELYARHESQIVNSATADQFAQNLGILVGEIGDLHFRVYDTNGTNTVRYTRQLQRNFNQEAISRIVPITRVNDRISTAIVQNVGYLQINSWLGDYSRYFRVLPELLQTTFRDTNALIIDLRMNGGGNWNFAGEPTAPGHDGIGFVHYFSGLNPGEVVHIGYFDWIQTSFYDRRLIPHTQRGIPENMGVPYTNPVVILIGESSASTTETFLTHMAISPNTITIGDTTAGTSGGSVVEHILSNGVSVWPSKVAALDVNRNIIIEDIGIQPDVHVPFINNGSDNVLIAAFAHLGVTVTDGGGGTPPPGNGNTPPPSDSSGGGGCNAGVGFGVLVLAVFFFIRRRA